MLNVIFVTININHIYYVFEIEVCVNFSVVYTYICIDIIDHGVIDLKSRAQFIII